MDAGIYPEIQPNINPNKIIRQTAPPRPNYSRSKSLQVFRHWVDPTVKHGIFNRCLNLTCHIRFDGYIVASTLTVVIVFFSFFCLIFWKFDIPNGGNSICFSLIAASLALWAKPINSRGKKKKKNKNSVGSDSTSSDSDIEMATQFLDSIQESYDT